MLDSLRNKPGRIIALGRIALALTFLVAIWLDPTQPAIAPTRGYIVLGVYVALAVVYLIGTWDNWYLDWRLALPAHAVDIAMFAIMVYLTEGYTSPFYTQFVFLVLAAAIRWTWRATAITAIIVIALFFAVGVASIEFGNGEFELQRFLFRGAYLFVLSMMLIWFGINQNGDQRARSSEGELAADETLGADNLVGYAADGMGAGVAALLWTDHEEPWVHGCIWRDGVIVSRKMPPKSLDKLVSRGKDKPGAIVDLSRREKLVLRGRGFIIEPVSAGLAEAITDTVGASLAIVASFRTDELAGALVLADIPGICDNHIRVANEIALEIQDSLSRHLHRQLASETAAAEVRLALARDLHDSLAQILAGTAMRLETVRRRARDGGDVGSEIDSLQAELSLEQRDLRGLIARLRGLSGAPDTVSLSSSLSWLGQRLSRQWGIECVIGDVAFPDAISGEFDYQLRQIVREAAANAARHGSATTVQIAAKAEDGHFALEIVDDGRGYGFEDGTARKPAKPKSLRERVRRLGGELAVESAADGTVVIIRIPEDKVL